MWDGLQLAACVTPGPPMGRMPLSSRKARVAADGVVVPDIQGSQARAAGGNGDQAPHPRAPRGGEGRGVFHHKQGLSLAQDTTYVPTPEHT